MSHWSPRPRPHANPHAGPPCLRCDRTFTSWDHRQNRLCRYCRETMDRDPSEERVYPLLKPGRRPRDG